MVIDRGYRKLVQNGKRVFEHRLILEAKLGRPLKAHEVTHHINGDKLDNRSENLQVLTQPEHIKLHDIGRSTRFIKTMPEKLLRKQFLITDAQQDYLRTLSDAIGQSECHIVRQAIELHAKHLSPDSIPGLIYEEPNTEGKPNELES